MSKKTDRVISDHIVVDALLIGAKTIINLSDEEIGQKYARQERNITKDRADTIREIALDIIRPVIDAVAQRGGIDYEFPTVKKHR
jgi:hypothetical protein